MSFQLSMGEIKSVGNQVALTGNGDYRIETTGEWDGVLLLQKSIDGGHTWLTKRAVISKNDHNVVIVDSELSKCQLRVIASEWRGGSCDVVMQFTE